MDEGEYDLWEQSRGLRSWRLGAGELHSDVASCSHFSRPPVGYS
jgi:hypothetical protein